MGCAGGLCWWVVLVGCAGAGGGDGDGDGDDDETYTKTLYGNHNGNNLFNILDIHENIE